MEQSKSALGLALQRAADRPYCRNAVSKTLWLVKADPVTQANVEIEPDYKTMTQRETAKRKKRK
jgi:hypothetical protein